MNQNALSCIGAIVKADRQVNSICQSLPSTARPHGTGTDFQAKVFKILRARTSDEYVQGMLRMRLSRWMPLGVYPDVQLCVTRLRRVGRRLKLWAPVIALLRIASRGVCTGWRFQCRGTACRFGCTHGIDRVEHFFACPVLVTAVQMLMAKLHIHAGPPVLVNGGIDERTLLLLDMPRPGHHDTYLVLLADSICHAHSAARVSQQTLHVQSTFEHLVARFRHYRTISAAACADLERLR